MQLFFFSSLLLGLLFPVGLYWAGRNHIRSGHPSQPPVPGKDGFHTIKAPPKTAVIIALTGKSTEMKESLKTLLNQDFPDYEVFLVTRDAADPAAGMIRELLQSKSTARNIRHILSGPAVRCGQKNHNLLAAVEAVDPTTRILVFCDSTHRAHPTLLWHLVFPILQGQAVLTSGFHRIVPKDFGVATLGHLFSVLIIHMLQGIPLVTQPWGGAMAVDRKIFESHGIARLWAKTVVDDFSMGPYLQRKGIRCLAVSRACLTTALSGDTLKAWHRWLTRQLLYLKFYTPGAWAAAALGVAFLMAPTLMSGLAVLGAPFGFCPFSTALAGLGFLGMYTGIGLMYRRLIPETIPPLPWIFSFFTFHAMLSYCYLNTWFTKTLTWKGLSYHIARGGRVKRICTHPKPPSDK